MPELPEVETIRRDLAAALTHKTISAVHVKDLKALTGIGPSGKPRRKVTLEGFKSNVLGKKIMGFGRKGKYLAILLGGKEALIVHLRMTGQLLLSKPDYPERLAFTFSDGAALYYSDRRRFGEIYFSSDWERDPSVLALGVEPGSGGLTGDYLKTSFRGRSAPVYSILLSQSLVSGLGNIYVTEALFRSGIRPTKPCGKISIEKLSELAGAVNAVISESIEHRGYSMSTYVDAMGKKGRSQMFSLAYGKDGLPCPKCGSLFKRKVFAGRGAVYCASCQK